MEQEDSVPSLVLLISGGAVLWFLESMGLSQKCS